MCNVTSSFPTFFPSSSLLPHLLPLPLSPDEYKEHVRALESIRLRASRLMNIDVIHQTCSLFVTTQASTTIPHIGWLNWPNYFQIVPGDNQFPTLSQFPSLAVTLEHRILNSHSSYASKFLSVFPAVIGHQEGEVEASTCRAYWLQRDKTTCTWWEQGWFYPQSQNPSWPLSPLWCNWGGSRHWLEFVVMVTQTNWALIGISKYDKKTVKESTRLLESFVFDFAPQWCHNL